MGLRSSSKQLVSNSSKSLVMANRNDILLGEQSLAEQKRNILQTKMPNSLNIKDNSYRSDRGKFLKNNNNQSANGDIQAMVLNSSSMTS